AAIRLGKIAPHLAVDEAAIVLAFAVGVVKPGLVVVGVGIPGARTGAAEISRVIVAPDVSQHFCDGGLIEAFSGGYQGKLTVSHVIGEVGIDYRQATLARTFVFHPYAVIHYPLTKLKVLLHIDP